MKRLATLFLAAGLLLGSSQPASAVDIKVSGLLQYGFEWASNLDMKPKQDNTFRAVQRLRTQIDIMASENLKGVLFIEIGKTQWGKGEDGGVGSDAKNVKPRHSYLDWQVPSTNLKLRMGLQPIELPNYVAGENVFGVYVAAVTLSYLFNDNVELTTFWARALNDNDTERRQSTQNDSADFFSLILPTKGDGFKLTPWALVGSVGNSSLFADPSSVPCDLDLMRQGLLPFGSTASILAQSPKDYSAPWWVGIGGELTAFSPFRLAAEARYGRSDFGKVSAWNMAAASGNAYYANTGVSSFDLKREGWYAGLLAEYSLTFMKPGLIFWYTSGDDGNPYNGSESMPYVSEQSHRGWNATNFGYSGESDRGVSSTARGVMGLSNIGTWGVVAQINDISLFNSLTHTIKFGYYQGTNNRHMPARAGMQAFRGDDDHIYMTTKDRAFEIDFSNNYKIYENLDVSIELDYIRLDMDRQTWLPAMGQGRWDLREKNAYRMGVYMSRFQVQSATPSPWVLASSKKTS